jgi:hypothetical protein
MDYRVDLTGWNGQYCTSSNLAATQNIRLAGGSHNPDDLALSNCIFGLAEAAINAQSEEQTAKDSTRRPPAPMGRRDARAADAVGEASDR